MNISSSNLGCFGFTDQQINTLSNCQFFTLEDMTSLSLPVIIERIQIVLEGGEVVTPRQNLLDEVELFKNLLPRDDYNWLIIIPDSEYRKLRIFPGLKTFLLGK